MRRLATLCLALCCSALAAAPSEILFVRHAEKAAEPSDDPALSEAGERRAQQLAAVLADAGIRHIVTTQWRRTRDTAAPLAARLGLPPQVVATRRGVKHADEVLALLQGLQGRVLVVGHSNTVPELIAALGGPRLPMICESSFGHLLLLRPADASLLRLRYGAADPPPAPDCL